MFFNITAEEAIILRIIQLGNGTTTHSSIVQTLKTNHGISKNTALTQIVGNLVALLTSRNLIEEGPSGVLSLVPDEGSGAPPAETFLIQFKNIITPYMPS